MAEPKQSHLQSSRVMLSPPPRRAVRERLSVDWFRAVNGYCERTDASYWSEPVNALSNAAFLDRRLALPGAWRGGPATGRRSCSR